MPTIKQLPTATSVSVTDVLPVSQGGTTRGLSVGNLLSSTQPALSLASGSLLGRVSATAGGPEPVGVGGGLALGSGLIMATGDDHTRLAISASLSPTDEVVVNSGGIAKRMAATLLRGLFAAGTGVIIDGNGTISASATSAGIVSGTASSGHLVLTRGDAVTVDCGPVLAVPEPLVPTVVADGATGTDNWAAIQAALDTGRDVLLPRGEIRISHTLTMTSSSQRLMGYGPGTRLRPDFTTGDVIRIGGPGPTTLNVSLQDFTIWPSVMKTSGAGIKGINGSHLRFSGVWLGTYEDATSGLRLYQGFELSDCSEVVVSGGGALGCLENGILLYGSAAASEIIIAPSVQLATNGCAVHIGGAMGGVYVSGDIQQNGQGVVVSLAYSSVFNREIFLNGAIIDSNVHEGFIVEPNAIAGCLIVNGGWCCGTASPASVGFSVLSGNAVTIIHGMRCDGNAGVGALLAGGPVLMSNFHAAQNHMDSIQVAATCGGIYSTGAKLTESITGAGWRFPAVYGSEVSITGGSVNANAGGTIINPPIGVGQFIVGVVGYNSIFTVTRPTSGQTPADASGGATGWNLSNGLGEVTEWNTFTGFVPAVSHEWRQKLAGGGNSLLMQLGTVNGVPVATIGQGGTVWHSANLQFGSDFSYDATGHVLSLATHVIAGAAIPIVDGVGAAGSSTAYARQDHVHPGDTSRLAAALNLADVTSVSAARTNLGLSAVASTGAYSDLSGRPSLGNAAALSVGVASGTVAAGDDSRITGALSAAFATANYAPLASPTFVGTPVVPTAAPGVNSGQVASTAFVKVAVAGAAYTLTAATAGVLGGVKVGSGLSVTSDGTLSASGVATPLASTAPSMDGVAAIGASASAARADHVHPSDTTRLAAASNLSDLPSASAARTNLGLSIVAASGAYADLTGRPALGGAASLNVGASAGTVTAGDDGRVVGALAASTAAATYAPLANPALTGVPTAPTAALGTSTSQVASTAFVRAATAVGLVTVSNGASYAMQTADQIVLVNKTVGGATALSLPASPATGVAYNIKDGRGDANANPITVSDPSGKTIDGAASLLINQNRGAETLRWTGAEWSVF